jgi:hypothetical protein
MLMAIGLTTALVGSFVAARLMRIDRLWTGLGGPDYDARARATRQDLVNLATQTFDATGPRPAPLHPLIATAAPLLRASASPDQLRRTLAQELARAAGPSRAARSLGSALSLASPIAGLGLLITGLFSALSTLQGVAGSATLASGPAPISPTSALSLMALVIAVPLVATIARRLPSQGQAHLVRNELLAQGVLESLILIAEHRHHPELPARIAEHFDELLGPALDADHADAARVTTPDAPPRSSAA